MSVFSSNAVYAQTQDMLSISTVHQLEQEVHANQEVDANLSRQTTEPFRVMELFSTPYTFEIRANEHGLTSQEIFQKRFREQTGTCFASTNQTPEIHTIQPQPAVARSEGQRLYTEWHYDPSEQQILDDPAIMTPIPQTYDMYRCNDCNVVLSGYKKGAANLEEHIWKGSARCRYVKAKFKDRTGDLIVLHGKMRFYKGLMALPEYVLSAKDGYTTISRHRHCVVCSAQDSEGHYINCAAMAQVIALKVRDLSLVSSNDSPLFYNTRSRAGSLELNPSFQLWVECGFRRDPANMHHILGTIDEHQCAACGLGVRGFVDNDTLLGEHIYHVYNNNKASCSYIERRFRGKRENVRLIVGYERYRKGYVAFPEALTNSYFGYVEINGRFRCVVCGHTCGAFTSLSRHRTMCSDIKESLSMKLRFMSLVN